MIGFRMIARKKSGFVFFIIVALMTTCHLLYAQQSDSISKSKFSSGIDIVNTLTFLKKNEESYLLNFRYHLNPAYTLRAGLNIDISAGEALGYYPDIKLGVQRNNHLKKWNWFYGADVSYSYFKSSSNPVETTRIGGACFLGVEYFFNKRISIVTEQSLNFHQFYQHNPDTFELEKTTSYNRLFIGSVGMLIVFFHF
jgi:hypothetical protein